MKIGTRVRLKPSNDRGECELDWAKSKNNIAENLIALGHKTDNRNCIVYKASTSSPFTLFLDMNKAVAKLSLYKVFRFCTRYS